jgi:hypothetical protein
VLFIIVYDRVELLLGGICKVLPSGFSHEWCRFIHGVPLPITFQPRNDMGNGFKEREGDNFSLGNFLDRVISF